MRRNHEVETNDKKNKVEADHNHVLASATLSASYNMVYQLSFRLLTFVLNACILRYITKDLLGIVNVRLTLLFATPLFIAREPFRRAYTTKSKHTAWAQVINLVWFTLPICIVCASMYAVIWVYLIEQPDSNVVPYYRLGVAVFATSTVIMTLPEPVRMVSQILLYPRIRFVVEGLAQAIKCLTTIALIATFPDMGLAAFCIAQIIFAVCYVGFFYVYFFREIQLHQHDKQFPFTSLREFFPQRLHGKAWIDWDMAKLTWSFMKQSFLKMILTDGELYLMTVFGVLSFGDQGVYDVINNLGSLVARFVFQPIEESAYLLFSQTLERGKAAKEQSKSAIEMATGVLECLLKGVMLISLIILVFGYAYSYLLLTWYGGTILTSGPGPLLLRCYCGYVLLLAINGVSEGFVFATMSKQEVDKYNHKMLLFSAVFLISAYYFTAYLGSVGFILANSLNMLARIIHSLYFITKFYWKSNYIPLKGLLPSPAVVVVLLISFAITVISERTFCCHLGLLWQGLHVLIGAVCLLLTLMVIYISEKNLVTFIKDRYRKMTNSKSS